MKCSIYNTECINEAYCGAREACCAGDPGCQPPPRLSVVSSSGEVLAVFESDAFSGEVRLRECVPQIANDCGRMVAQGISMRCDPSCPYDHEGPHDYHLEQFDAKHSKFLLKLSEYFAASFNFRLEYWDGEEQTIREARY